MEKVDTRDETIKVATAEATEAKRKSSGMSPAILNRIACTIAGQLPANASTAAEVLDRARQLAGIELPTPSQGSGSSNARTVLDRLIDEYWYTWGVLDEMDSRVPNEVDHEEYSKLNDQRCLLENRIAGMHCASLGQVQQKADFLAELMRRDVDTSGLFMPFAMSVAHAGAYEPIDNEGDQIAAATGGYSDLKTDTLVVFSKATQESLDVLAATIEGMGDGAFRDWAAAYAIHHSIPLAVYPAELTDLIERHDATMQLANEVRSDAIANLHIKKAEKIVGQIAAHRCENLEDIRLKATFLIRAAELEFNDGHPFFGRWGLPVLKSLTEGVTR